MRVGVQRCGQGRVSALVSLVIGSCGAWRAWVVVVARKMRVGFGEAPMSQGIAGYVLNDTGASIRRSVER